MKRWMILRRYELLLLIEGKQILHNQYSFYFMLNIIFSGTFTNLLRRLQGAKCIEWSIHHFFVLLLCKVNKRIQLIISCM